MKIGIISDQKLKLSTPASADWVIYNFSLSKKRLSSTEILDSAFATPSRYIQEVYSRIAGPEEQQNNTKVFIFNPLFETNKPSLIISLNTLEKALPFNGITVLTDFNDLPIGYYLPSTIPSNDRKYLSLLSGTSGSLDAELLQLLLNTNTRCLTAPSINLKKFDNCGFSFKDLAEIYTWTAQKSRDVILNAYAKHAQKAPSIDALQKCRDNIPFTAIMPFHAGDVLFFSIAFKYTKTHISRLAVNSAYKNIASEVVPELEFFIITPPPPNREPRENGSRPTPDHVFFNQVKSLFPSDCFYYFCRQSRNYNLPEFHLIDQFAFALGRPSHTTESLLFNSKNLPSLFRPQITTKRILLHFDGGWPLKIYPTELQEKLTKQLIDNGYEVTVLSNTPSPNLECEVVPFSNLESFKELLKSHHLLVGMDSFPCHYAAHILGLPTICLFSSTKPSNSNAPATASYSYLEMGLKCRPCYATDTCPINGKDFCQNFTPPEIVFEKVEKILIQCYESPASTGQRTAISVQTHGTSFDSPVSKKRQIVINTSHLEFRAYVSGMILPFYCYSSTLLREFATAVQREGIIGALRRTARYLVRQIK